MDTNFQLSTVEALIMASPDPLPARKIADLLDGYTPARVAQAVANLNSRYMESGSSFRIREVAGGYQIFIVPEFSGYVQEMFSRTRKMRLTRAALETLAIVAYRQPVTRVEIEQVRGVASDSVIHNLIEKNMITIKGRANTVGKPLQYGTTEEFLKFFGLNQVDDLPKMSEIEELLASQTEQLQDEFDADSDNGNGNRLIKLNLVDGFSESDNRLEIDDGTEPSDLDESEEDTKEGEGEPASVATPRDEGSSDSGNIVDIDTT